MAEGLFKQQQLKLPVNLLESNGPHMLGDRPGKLLNSL